MSGHRATRITVGDQLATIRPDHTSSPAPDPVPDSVPDPRAGPSCGDRIGLTVRRHYSGADEHHKTSTRADHTADHSGSQQITQQTIAVHRCKTTIRERMTCGR
ncbi:hypothetical protein SVIO_047500 [Streptomyces violaceusniger]|uniref:Uncharacterized protein n=1 Tax=Streptomyces violaceusniger TaxID=68280 RepID=A0A4D4L646_STRVO|nr:hypothetical protein SVIO_047500 [Streptomyces violaceusniger]